MLRCAMERPRLGAFLATGGYLEHIVQEARRHQVIFDVSLVLRLLVVPLLTACHRSCLVSAGALLLCNGRLPPSHATAVLCAKANQSPTSLLHPL